MKISVIGTGYVGLVTGVCFAEIGHEVSCIDIDKEKIERLKRGISPIYEPGIEKMLIKHIKKGKINFFDNVGEGIAGAEAIFIAVGTPSKDDGTVEIKYVEKVADDIGRNLKRYAVVVNKSTVPVGTGERVSKIISKRYRGRFDVVSNPEFLREGQAIKDFMKPDRVVIGAESERARKIMQSIYELIKTEMLFTDLKTAEMIKYASNAFLATSISFINSLATLCEKAGADINEVAKGMRLDRRIGKYAFLSAGPGYGGSCFPKDVKGLISMAREQGLDLPLLSAAEDINERQGEIVFDKVKKLLGSLQDKTVAIWGLAFKPETDDLRESPAVKLVERLLKAGAEVKCFDSVAEDNGRKVFPNVIFAFNPLEALSGADCLVIMTEWAQFREITLGEIKKYIRGRNIMDARNIFKKEKALKAGFNYEGIGQ